MNGPWFLAVLRRRLRLCAAVLLALGSSMLAGAMTEREWTDPRFIDGGASPMMQFGTGVVLDAAGNAIVVWNMFDGDRGWPTTARMATRRFTVGTGWEPPELLNEPTSGVDLNWDNGRYVAVDGDGNAVAAWIHLEFGHNEQRWQILANRYTNGVGWDGAEALTELAPYDTGGWRGESEAPQVVMTPAGDAFAIWTALWYGGGDGPAGVWASRKVNAAPWNGAVLLRDSASLAEIAADGQGNVLAVVITSDRQLWAHRYVAGTGWTVGERVSGSGEVYEAAVGMHVNGNAVAVWSSDFVESCCGYGQTTSIWANSFTPASGWAAPQQIASSDTALYPKVVVDNDGNAMAVWSSDMGIQAARFSAHGGWAGPETIGPKWEGTPWDVGIDGGGAVLVVWSESVAGYSTLAWRTYVPGSGWQPTQFGPRADYLQLSVNAGGDAIAVGSRSVYLEPLGWGFHPTASLLRLAPPNKLSPELRANFPLDVVEGDASPIGAEALAATDGDNAPSEIVYRITRVPSAGTVRMSAPAALDLPVWEFTQRDVENGWVRYQHDGGENTADSFDFTVQDGGPDTQVIGPFTFDIAVTPANDAPIAEWDLYRTDLDGRLKVPAPGVLANDTDPDSQIVAALVSPPSKAADFEFNPDGSFHYTVVPKFEGRDTFTYEAYDGEASSLATVSIWVDTRNQPPYANEDVVLVYRDSVENVIDVLANDSDPDGDPLTLVAVTDPDHGTATISGNRALYSPTRGFVGSDVFFYTVSDGTTTDIGRVSIDIPSPAPAPAPAPSASSQDGGSGGASGALALAVLAGLAALRRCASRSVAGRVYGA